MPDERAACPAAVRILAFDGQEPFVGFAAVRVFIFRIFFLIISVCYKKLSVGIKLFLREIIHVSCICRLWNS